MTGPGALPAAEVLTARTGLYRSQSPAFAALRRGATDVPPTGSRWPADRTV